MPGRHCCLWCLATSEELKKPPESRPNVQLRDLDGIQSDHQRFMTEGHGDLRKAKLFNNAIQPHFFDIPLSQVILGQVDRNHITLTCSQIAGLPTRVAHHIGDLFSAVFTFGR